MLRMILFNECPVIHIVRTLVSRLPVCSVDAGDSSSSLSTHSVILRTAINLSQTHIDNNNNPASINISTLVNGILNCDASGKQIPYIK